MNVLTGEVRLHLVPVEAVLLLHLFVNPLCKANSVTYPAHHTGRIPPVFLTRQPDGSNEASTQINDLARRGIRFGQRNSICE